jgi:hypothetical protein
MGAICTPLCCIGSTYLYKAAEEPGTEAEVLLA